MIAPPAITRWAATAHDRVLTSLFQAWLSGWVEQKLFIEKADTDKIRAPRFETVNDVNRLFTGNDLPGAAKDFMEFCVLALGVPGRGVNRIGAAPHPDYYDGRIRNLAKQLTDEFRSENATTRLARLLGEFSCGTEADDVSPRHRRGGPLRSRPDHSANPAPREPTKNADCGGAPDCKTPTRPGRRTRQRRRGGLGPMHRSRTQIATSMPRARSSPTKADWAVASPSPLSTPGYSFFSGSPETIVRTPRRICRELVSACHELAGRSPTVCQSNASTTHF